jgi:hypothetical protein
VSCVQGSLRILDIIDPWNVRLSGAALSKVDDRYVRGLITFVGSGQICVIQTWNVSSI